MTKYLYEIDINYYDNEKNIFSIRKHKVIEEQKTYFIVDYDGFNCRQGKRKMGGYRGNKTYCYMFYTFNDAKKYLLENLFNLDADCSERELQEKINGKLGINDFIYYRKETKCKDGGFLITGEQAQRDYEG